MNDARELRTDRVGKADMHYDAITKEGRNASLRPIVKLVRQNDVERSMFLFERSHSTGGDNPFHPELLEAVNVGAEVKFRWRDRVIAVVPREQKDAMSSQCADTVAIGWGSNRS